MSSWQHIYITLLNVPSWCDVCIIIVQDWLGGWLLLLGLSFIVVVVVVVFWRE